jgi:hypothetical protein
MELEAAAGVRGNQEKGRQIPQLTVGVRGAQSTYLLVGGSGGCVNPIMMRGEKKKEEDIPHSPWVCEPRAEKDAAGVLHSGFVRVDQSGSR